MASERRITTSRLGRFSALGRLAAGVAGGMATEGARQLLQGHRPVVEDLLLTPANARRVATRLSELRGAAMKVGQLLSMDGGQLLPPQLSELLDDLRENAHQMPLGEVAQVLKQAWGKGWEAEFERFNFKPIAAASIGQVHDATLRDGRRLAIKIQYPGIRRSIDSDVDNVGALLRVFNLLPDGMQLEPLLTEAKQQLHMEADYRIEAGSMARFAALLGDHAGFAVPRTIDALCSQEVLAMQFFDGRPIEHLHDQAQELRNEVATRMLDLALRELFDWGLVQTDPNFANYLYQPASGQIQLLDFGATRIYSAERRLQLAELLRACLDGDEVSITDAALGIGYLSEADPGPFREYIVQLLRIVTEPVCNTRRYSFTDTTLARRARDIVIDMRIRNKFARVPPPDVLFLHRKLGGLYLLLTRLRATVPVRKLIEQYLGSESSAQNDRAA